MGKARPEASDEQVYFRELAVVVVVPLLFAVGGLCASQIASLPLRIGTYVSLPLISAILCSAIISHLERTIAARQAEQARQRNPPTALPEEGQEMALRVLISFAVGVAMHLLCLLAVAAILGLMAWMRK